MKRHLKINFDGECYDWENPGLVIEASIALALLLDKFLALIDSPKAADEICWNIGSTLLAKASRPSEIPANLRRMADQYELLNTEGTAH